MAFLYDATSPELPKLTLFGLPLQQLPNVGQALIKGVLGLWVEMPIGDVYDILGSLHGLPQVAQSIGVC